MSALRSEVERALLLELRRAWAVENHHRFRGALRPPGFRLDDRRARLAAWEAPTREIVVSRGLVLGWPWGQVVEVLKHEMAHQYAHEVLGAHDETAHGRAFREVCARFGVDPAASGVPDAHGAPPAGEAAPEHRVMERVRKLLALAESPNAHEAQAAMNAAQALLLRHNLDQVEARPTYTWAQLDPALPRVQAGDRWVSAILRAHFFVEGVWVPVFVAATGRSAQRLEVCGTPENVAMARYVNDFLRATADRLWAAQRPRPRGGQRAFFAGMMRGFHEKLEAQRQEQAEVGLVWLGDPGVRRYLSSRYPALRTVRRSGPRMSEAWEEGRAAGRELVLHRPVTEGRGYAGKLLPGSS